VREPHDPVVSVLGGGGVLRSWFLGPVGGCWWVFWAARPRGCRSGLPALDRRSSTSCGQGRNVADVGCGLGASTIIMAEAFERSTFVGLDPHEPSIVAARNGGGRGRAWVSGRGFEVGTAKDFHRSGYDLMCLFDCLHDMGDPVGAAAASGRPWRRTARCCWSSRWPATAWSTT